MAVKIRLMRVGKKKQPTYRVVVADARSPRDGRFIEIIGQYAPRQEPSLVTIDSERALHWLRNGAQPTEEAAKLLEISGVWDAYTQDDGQGAGREAEAEDEGAQGEDRCPKRRRRPPRRRSRRLRKPPACGRCPGGGSPGGGSARRGSD